MPRQINQAGLNIIKTFEGCRLSAYQDQGGLWTIGYGHTGTEVGPGLNISQEQADALLIKDLATAEGQVECQITVPLNDNQFSALVSLVFNIGGHNFYDSTLKKRLNEGNYKVAANWFMPWCKIHGVEVEGLLRRREAEMRLFLTNVV